MEVRMQLRRLPGGQQHAQHKGLHGVEVQCSNRLRHSAARKPLALGTRGLWHCKPEPAQHSEWSQESIGESAGAISAKRDQPCHTAGKLCPKRPWELASTRCKADTENFTSGSGVNIRPSK